MQTYLLIVYGMVSLAFFLFFFFKRRDAKLTPKIFIAYVCLMTILTAFFYGPISNQPRGHVITYSKVPFFWLFAYLSFFIALHKFVFAIKNNKVRTITILLFLGLLLSHLAVNANKMRNAFYHYQCKGQDHGKIYHATDWESPYAREQKIFFILFPRRHAINDCYKK